MPSVSNFLPSRNGFRFTNTWPHEPDVVIHVPVLGDLKLGDASNGLCGGMVFAVRDIFEAGLPQPAQPQPPQGSPLFDYIVSRLLASLHIPTGVAKYYEWMNKPDQDRKFLWVFVLQRGVAWLTIKEEWPKVKADLDAGRLSPLGLITVHSTNPMDLGKNHQVLAYGYDLDSGNNLTIHVYDPNTQPARADSVTLSLNIGSPSRPSPIKHNIGIGEPVRGFFSVPYAFSDPSRALAAP